MDEPPTGAPPEPRMDAGTARDSPDVTKVGAGPDMDRSMATPAECEAIDSQSEQTDRMVITAITDIRGTTNIEPPTQAQEQAAEELKKLYTVMPHTSNNIEHSKHILITCLILYYY